jgi:hypothetical protein
LFLGLAGTFVPSENCGSKKGGGASNKARRQSKKKAMGQDAKSKLVDFPDRTASSLCSTPALMPILKASAGS